MVDFSLWDILRNLLLAARWTVAAVADRLRRRRRWSGGAAAAGGWLRCPAQRGVAAYVQLFQGTPLLMQLFLAYFGLALLGCKVSAWVAAALALTLYTSAFLAEIWRGCVTPCPKGQWEAAAQPGAELRRTAAPRDPARRRCASPSRRRWAFLVQVIKGTALASVIGFIELTKAGTMITNATFKPFVVYACVALMYFALCWPDQPGAACSKGKLHGPLTAPVADRPIVRSRACASASARNEVLKGIDLPCSRGEVIAIIGKSGSGKSTLLRCINGLEVFQHGALSVDGQPLEHDDPKAMRALRQHVGMIFQSFNLFPHLSVGRNVMLAPTLVKQTGRRQPPRRARACAARARGPGREVRRLARPALGRPAAARGHRARAGHGPSVLLCDEITSALDPELVGEVLGVVEAWPRRHDAADGHARDGFARKVSDRVIFMHPGRVHEMGPPAELFGSAADGRAEAVPVVPALRRRRSSRISPIAMPITRNDTSVVTVPSA
jgi:polar amino acid transport system ATP-binding protein